MYQPQPPSIQHFSPDISRQPRMPSPPSCLRPLVNRLNKPPTPSLKTTVSRHEPNPPLASHQSDRDQESKPTTKALQSYAYAGSTASSSEPPEVNQGPERPELAQLLSHFFGTGNNLDLAECKIEVHLHMHANPRPAFPPPYSQHERLKRKREATSHGRECDDDGEGAERSAKKVKLSHCGEVQRVPSEDGRNLPTGDSNRSRMRTRGMTSRQRRAERRKHLRGY